MIHDNDDLILSTDVGVCRYNFKSDTLKLITGNLATKNMFHIEDTLIVLTNTSVEYYSKDALKIKSFMLFNTGLSVIYCKMWSRNRKSVKIEHMVTCL